MKERLQKTIEYKNKLSLRTRLVLLIGLTVIASSLAGLGISTFLQWLIPPLVNVPDLLQLNVLSFFIGVILARFITNILWKPVEEMCNAMQKVADGDYTVRLDTKSTTGEIQEMVSGFNMMVQELKSTEILQSDFVSNVSHEFKTPINAIEGYTTLLQGTDNIDEVESEYIDKILFNTKRLSSLVSNILLMSKIENRLIQTNKEVYNLDEQIRETIVALESMWEPKQIDFDVDLADIKYYGSENLIFHIWNNLLNNAIKFSPQSGIIKMRLFEKDDTITFYIENNGPQLSEQALKHIFDKFYQEDTSHKSEGNGLGLALVKKILLNIGGSITAENIPEGGCRFTVILKNEEQEVTQ